MVVSFQGGFPWRDCADESCGDNYGIAQSRHASPFFVKFVSYRNRYSSADSIAYHRPRVRAIKKHLTKPPRLCYAGNVPKHARHLVSVQTGNVPKPTPFMTKNPTILDVARAAGVSKSTVSRVLQGSDASVSDAARRQVQAASKRSATRTTRSPAACAPTAPIR